MSRETPDDHLLPPSVSTSLPGWHTHLSGTQTFSTSFWSPFPGSLFWKDLPFTSEWLHFHIAEIGFASPSCLGAFWEVRKKVSLCSLFSDKRLQLDFGSSTSLSFCSLALCPLCWTLIFHITILCSGHRNFFCSIFLKAKVFPISGLLLNASLPCCLTNSFASSRSHRETSFSLRPTWLPVGSSSVLHLSLGDRVYMPTVTSFCAHSQSENILEACGQVMMLSSH